MLMAYKEQPCYLETDSRVSFIIHEYAVNGISLNKSAKKLGVACPTVLKWLSRCGLKVNFGRKSTIREYVPCCYCGKEIRRWKSQNNKRIFCSRSCYWKWLSENTTGENSPSWKGGITAISSQGLKTPEWRELKKQFLSDYPTCFMCGGDHRPHVHHIIPRRIRRELIYEYDNLSTLCNVCHSKIKGKEGEWESFLRGYKCNHQPPGGGVLTRDAAFING
jgi:5-methylcytosine-specific restriction endonuclease McrA